MSSKLSRFLGLSAVALTVFVDGAAEALGEVPDSLMSDGRDRPVWRSLATVNADGAMRWELFSDAEKHIIDLQIRQGRKMLNASDASSRSGACLEIEPLIGDVPLFENISATSESSAAIYVGTVTDAKPGFLESLLGTVYELAVDRDLKSGAAGPVPPQVLVFYPAAQAQVDGVKLCPVGFRGGLRPQVGARLLIFASNAVLASGPVLRPNDSDVIFETAGGALSVPSNLRDVAGLGLAATDLSLIEGVIEDALNATEERR